MEYALKHGENPHQQGSIIIDEDSDDPLALHQFRTATGEPLATYSESMGWIYLTDLSHGIDVLTRVAAAFEKNIGTVPQICILVQHGNTCGAAFGQTADVLHQAIECNYRASFNSFLVTNVPLTKDVAFRLRQWMPAQRPFSGIAAPVFDEAGAAFFARKKGTCHIVANPALRDLGVRSLQPERHTRGIRGATLHQTTNVFVPEFPDDWHQSLKEDMCLGWGICAASNSNCITAVKDGKLVTNAVGQPCRTSACEVAVLQADQPGRERESLLKGASIVSDSFFAFADGLDLLARKQVRAVFATSGSINDGQIAEHMKQFDVLIHTVPDSEGRVLAGH